MVQAISSGTLASTAQITINGQEIKVDDNEYGERRGLHLVLINPATGKAETKRAFDTYKSSESFDKFISSQ